MSEAYRRQANGTTRSRKEWRELIWPAEDSNRKAYDPRLIREFGSSAGLLIGQLVFWSEKGHDPDGWIYKTKREIEEEVGLSAEQTDRARNKLQRQGVIEAEKRSRRDATGRVMFPTPVWHYRVDLEALAKVLNGETPTLNHDSKPRESRDSSTGKYVVREPESPWFEPREARETYPGSPVTPTQRVRPQENVREEPQENNEQRVRLSGGEPAASQASQPASPQQKGGKPKGQNSENESRQPLFAPSTDPERKLLTEVREVLENGHHAPLALKHYRRGKIDLPRVAEEVAYDLTGREGGAGEILPAVESVLTDEEVAV